MCGVLAGGVLVGMATTHLHAGGTSLALRHLCYTCMHAETHAWQVMREMGWQEPLESDRNVYLSDFAKSSDLLDACAQMAKDLLDTALRPS